MRASIARRAGATLAILTTAALLAACAQAAPQEAAEAPPAPMTASSAERIATTPDAATETLAPAPTVASVTPPMTEQSGERGAPVDDDGHGSADADAGDDPPMQDAPDQPAQPAPAPVAAGEFTTQNGSASFTVPAGWTGIDRSWSTPDPDTGEPTWINIVELDGPGVRLAYLDTPQYGDNWSFDAEFWGPVDARQVGDGDHAQSFWTVEQGRYIPRVALTYLRGPNDWGLEEGAVLSPTWSGDSESNYRFEATFDGRPSFGTEAEVVAFLHSPAATSALEVIASIQFTGIDGRTLP